MRKFSVLGLCFAFMVMSQFVFAQEWPSGGWKVACVVTDDAVHEAEFDATVAGNTWTLRAGGHDIWNEADQFTYAYKEVSGDFDVSITVHSLDKTNDWSKAGIMARESLDPGSRNVYIACRGLDDLVTFQRREETDGSSASERATPSGAPRPVTLRLTRTGDEFMGGWSLDGGATWEASVIADGVTPTPPVILDLGDPTLLGVAATSHETGIMASAEVEVLGDVVTAVQPVDKLSVTWGTIKASN